MKFRTRLVVILLSTFQFLHAQVQGSSLGKNKICNEGLGECVPNTLCSNKTEFTDGSFLINSRFDLRLDDENSGECHYLEVCCDPENIVSDKEGQSVIVDFINQNAVDTCVQQCKAPEFAEYKKPPPKLIPETNTPAAQYCGYRNTFGVGLELTYKTDVAQFGEFPWMMALTEYGNYICGGSLIHSSVVLTAAHCIYSKDPKNLVVRAGEWDTQTTNEPFPHADHDVKQTIINPAFVQKSVINDVALLVLETPVKLTAHINTICLPPKNFKFEGSSCFASGWGADNYRKEGAYRANLKKLELPVISQKSCQDRLRTTKLGSLFKLHPSFMCAGGEQNVDTCIGDGGSPLVCPIPNEDGYYYQAGIVSWGIECGLETIPGVYANVAKFREWIDHEMIQLGFGTESYN